MDHPLTHRVEQFLRAFSRRRARIKIGPTGYSAHVIVNRERSESKREFRLSSLSLFKSPGTVR